VDVLGSDLLLLCEDAHQDGALPMAQREFHHHPQSTVAFGGYLHVATPSRTVKSNA